MVQFSYTPQHAGKGVHPIFEERIKNCIESLVRSRLASMRCPVGCPEHEVQVEVGGNWAEGDFEARVAGGCCASFVMSANAALTGVAVERRPAINTRAGFLAA